jgi:peptidoglycan lytic transglycosylase
MSMRKLIVLVVCVLGASSALVADSYEVAGKRYDILASARGYVEQGVASWYGKQFHGRRTASGEIYDMHAMTAAHKSLPIPTDVEVTNLSNGKKVIVRVNDRGPFVGQRILDLSYAAARALDLDRVGTGRVRVRALGRSSLATKQVASKRPSVVQVGAYRQRANAERMRRRLEAAGFDDIRLSDDVVGGKRLVCVRLGPVAGEEFHHRTIRRLAAIGVKGTFPVG